MDKYIFEYSSSLLITLFIFLFLNTGLAINSGNLETADSTKINEYIDSASKYINIKPDSAKFYVDSLLDLSIKSNNNYGLFKSYNFIGIYYWMYAEYDSALAYYKKALLYSPLTPQLRNKAIVLSNIGVLYRNLINTDSAVKYLNEAIQYSAANNICDLVNKSRYDLAGLYLNQANYIEALKNLKMVKDSLESNPDPRLNLFLNSLLGSLYYHVEDFDQSLIYLKRSINLDLEYEDINILANNYISIAQDYLELKKDTDSAVLYFNKALEVANDYNKDYVLINVNIGIGNVFMEDKVYDSAAKRYFKALSIPLIENTPTQKVAAIINIGIYYSEIEKYDKAKEYLTNGLELADSLKILHYQKRALLNLLLIAKKNKQNKEGMELFEKYSAINDSLQLEKTKQRLEKIKFDKYLADQEYNIRLLEKENTLKSNQIRNKSVLLGISVFAALILLIYLINIFINRTKIKRLAGQLSKKNEDLKNVNEELNSVNEELNSANDELTVQQSKLIEANKAKDKFFTIIGHDLKSPFNSLLGFLSVLNNDWDSLDDIEKKTIVKKLYNNTLGTFKLLEDLLDWGKTQRGLVTSNKIVFKVKPKIEEIYEVIRNQVKQKGLNLNINVENDFTINSDTQLFSHIILNLLNNAIKFTPKGGEINIFTEDENGVKKVCVKDSGIGFPKDKINNAFNFDFNFNRPGTENEKSSGMGLILCSEYARIMDAKLSLESEENIGSTFCLEFEK